MKNIKILLLLLAVVFSGGCDKDFDEINTNPNRPEDVPLTNVLLSAVTQGVRRTHGASMNMTYAGLWAQHYAKIQYIDEDNYDYRPDAFTAHFDALYSGPLADLQNIIDKADNPSNMMAAAMTMKAYYMGIVTDMWGEVPYSEALSVDRSITPKYDAQSDIYAGIVADLKTAAAMFGQADDLGQGDVIYGGDTGKWKKFANSLMARYLNRGKHKNPAFASDLQALLSNPGNLIASNSENAQFTYPGASPALANPLYDNKYNGGRNDHAVSETLVNIMSTINDPRLSVYAELNDQGVYKGQPNGTVEPSPFTAVSAIGSAFRDDPAAPSVLMTYAEVLFIMAEANDDKQAYLDAISASCAQHGVTADAAFLGTSGAAYDLDKNRALFTHKWIALFGDGCEAYTEFRRTHYPNEIQEVPGSVFPGLGVPDRFAYPTSESGNNKVNLDAAIQRQNIGNSGVHSDPMWWTL
ncbi:MAG: SusD/RagB family nutrient-binding outer membrane lipoprotein [Bacteroidetes bacterium]|nr:MAG: SusD/RagB family nutrient-binding outer membrane lipoprotein [Bacteroidota bacterium]